jgi:hypothetical protein
LFHVQDPLPFSRLQITTTGIAEPLNNFTIFSDESAGILNAGCMLPVGSDTFSVVKICLNGTDFAIQEYHLPLAIFFIPKNV